MSRLVVVSNRVARPEALKGGAQGGLAVGVLPRCLSPVDCGLVGMAVLKTDPQLTFVKSARTTLILSRLVCAKKNTKTFTLAFPTMSFGRYFTRDQI